MSVLLINCDTFLSCFHERLLSLSVCLCCCYILCCRCVHFPNILFAFVYVPVLMSSLCQNDLVSVVPHSNEI